ncbi:hypothetical protein J6590_042653 [Homalodisca vitripennis]|nr:hypothetical protein J6590_042653 [Homalodisca vitripennis]
MSVEGCSHLQTVKLIHKVLQTGKPEYLRRKLVFRHERAVERTVWLLNGNYSPLARAAKLGS